MTSNPIIRRIDELEDRVLSKQTETTVSVQDAMVSVDAALDTFKKVERAHSRRVLKLSFVLVLIFALVGGCTNHIYSVNTRATTCNTLNTIRQNNRDVLQLEVRELARIAGDPAVLGILPELLEALNNEQPILDCPGHFAFTLDGFTP